MYCKAAGRSMSAPAFAMIRAASKTRRVRRTATRRDFECTAVVPSQQRHLHQHSHRSISTTACARQTQPTGPADTKSQPPINHAAYQHSTNMTDAERRRGIEQLSKHYQEARGYIETTRSPLLPRMHTHAIYATTELSLDNVNVLGFDYDFTLANYTSQVAFAIYTHAQRRLVKERKYPSEIFELPYDPSFAIRGLHYDVKTGYLMKLDSSNHIFLDTVHNGLEKVPEETVLETYGGSHVAMDELFASYPRFQLLADMFAMPEVCLLANLTQFFKDSSIKFAPNHLFWDVKSTIRDVHISGEIHDTIVNDLDRYLRPSPRLLTWLQALRDHDKKLFLLTNSRFSFVDSGIKHLLGTEDWRDMFDFICVSAHKPAFFTSNRPFRRYNLERSAPDWRDVMDISQNHVLQEGNIRDMYRLTGWRGSSVLYFGDHVYSDLADPSKKFGWKTGAVIPELTHEVQAINSLEYQKRLAWFVTIRHLTNELQQYVTSPDDPLLCQWKHEIKSAGRHLMDYTNPRFGSVFRTRQGASFFSRRLYRFADIYTSSLTNFLQHPLWHTFYPRRMVMPHEPTLPFVSSHLQPEAFWSGL